MSIIEKEREREREILLLNCARNRPCLRRVTAACREWSLLRNTRGHGTCNVRSSRWGLRARSLSRWWEEGQRGIDARRFGDVPTMHPRTTPWTPFAPFGPSRGSLSLARFSEARRVFPRTPPPTFSPATCRTDVSRARRDGGREGDDFIDRA